MQNNKKKKFSIFNTNLQPLLTKYLKDKCLTLNNFCGNTIDKFLGNFQSNFKLWFLN